MNRTACKIVEDIVPRQTTDDLAAACSHTPSNTSTIVRDGHRLCFGAFAGGIAAPLFFKKFESPRWSLNVESNTCRVKRRTGHNLLNGEFATAGLRQAIEVALETLQIHCRFVGQFPFNRLPIPETSAIQEFLPPDLTFLEFVYAHTHALLRYGPRCQRAWLIAQLILAFPHSRIAIAASTTNQLQDLKDQLGRYGVSICVIEREYCPENPGRVVAGTYAALGHNEIESGKRHLLIALDAREIIGEQGQRLLCQVDARFRLLGLLPLGKRLTPREQDLIRAAFGFAEMILPAHGCLYRHVEYVVSPINDGPAISPNASPCELKARYIINNRIRNRRLARLAAAMAVGNASAASDFLSDANLHTGTPKNTTIVVDGIDHAVDLAERLPGWPIVCGPDPLTDGLTPRQRALLAERKTIWPTGERQIVTVAAISTFDIGATDVLIWAASGPAGPQLSAMQLAVCPDNPRPLNIVDTDDRQHPQLRQWSRQRREGYEAKGWFPLGEDPVQRRIEQWLNQPSRRCQ